MALRRVPEREFQKGLTWDTVKLIQDEIGDRPFMLKGIMTAEDALLAVEHGVQAIYVSNHGGRQLDHVQGSMEVLPAIVAAVGGKAAVIIDGGVTSLAELDGFYITKALPVRLPHEMSAFPHLPGERIV